MSIGIHYLLASRLCVFCRNGAHRTVSTTVSSRCSAKNYYSLLGVSQDASLEDIKHAFFTKSKKLHPDSDPNNPSLHTQFVKLNEAYRVLSREHSRKQYDSQLNSQSASVGGASRFDFTRPSSETVENIRYWQQFSSPPFSSVEFSPADKEKKHKGNKRLVLYCILIMLGSLVAHYIGFRKVEELHTNFMNEKDHLIMKNYNECKERARANGMKKQHEILRQKQLEFAEKQRIKPKSDHVEK
ncbi:dnaJ homolog subfamily C member 4 isoform X2 [Microcaecilia unicolor]|nr:dnaJ homolog subfamily C member 4 isoform X2 [Microcaecilia unicolor]XP_030074707.1 dnaJ homolog subfamily C member 4 isoform X2 [Microcaecilia unicolor]XP_030074709.1 dnaJ homolog subfamily C member 4 isoform X2 [Microcaecilia unicolor]XP_030074710.1 dnaJ homolog subfamily C member 4 isoform X2 [Microcaecilia unicolor]XP_030074711.1 dnaJ homolog subfamily C member 4 isoform X2 [Microcaecilia unicolor]